MLRGLVTTRSALPLEETPGIRTLLAPKLSILPAFHRTANPQNQSGVREPSGAPRRARERRARFKRDLRQRKDRKDDLPMRDHVYRYERGVRSQPDGSFQTFGPRFFKTDPFRNLTRQARTSVIALTTDPITQPSRDRPKSAVHVRGGEKILWDCRAWISFWGEADVRCCP